MAIKKITLDFLLELGYHENGPAIDCKATGKGTMVELLHQEQRYSVSLADYIVGTNIIPTSVGFHSDDKNLIKTALEKDLFYFSNSRKMRRRMLVGNALLLGGVASVLSKSGSCIAVYVIAALLAIGYAQIESDKETITRYYIQNMC